MDKRQQLVQRQQQLRERLESLQAHTRQGMDRHLEDQLQDLENADVRGEVARVLEQELAQVQSELDALNREQRL